MFTSDRRLYLDAAGNLSDEPVSGGKLLVAAGGELSAAEAARYGLGEAKGRKALEDKGRKATEEKREHPEPVQLEKLSKPELLAMLTERGLDTSAGTNAELVSRLKAAHEPGGG